jgi:hypothetical protein
MTHTPPPWKAVKNTCFWEIQPETRADTDPYQIGDVCASCPKNDVNELQKANADFIVRAVNNHDALVEALEDAEKALDLYGDKSKGSIVSALNNARVTLAKAKGD